MTRENIMILRNSFFSIFLMTSFLLVSQMAFASCDREDIDHYLGKGFTPKQITKICSSKTQQGIESEPSLGSPVVSNLRPENAGVDFLTSAIAATEIQFFEDKLSYVSRECVEYDPLPDALTVGGKKFCGFIRKTIDYHNLSVVQRPLLNLKFFAKPSILVKGDINYEIINATKLNQLTSHDHKLLLRKLSQMKTTAIPVREEFLINRVRAGINNLIND